MKIALEDSDIEKIAKAVAKAVGKVAPAKAKADEEDTDADASGDGDFEDGGDDGDGGDGDGEAPDRDAVKAAMTAVSKKVDQDTAMAILKKTGGVSALSKLPDAKFAAVIKACEAKVKGK